jgi:hypothetical protein
MLLGTSEALKKRFKFWILELKVCLKKLGLYGKSVLYLHIVPECKPEYSREEATVFSRVPS